MDSDSKDEEKCGFVKKNSHFFYCLIPKVWFKRHNRTKNIQFQYSWTEKEAKHHREHEGLSKTKVGMPWCTGRF